MTLTKLYRQFKQLPLWKKIVLIAFFPVVAIIIVMVLVSNDVSNEDIVNASKKKTDKEIKDFENSLKEIEKERKEIEEERKRIQKEIEDAKDNYNSTIDRIDNADDTELSDVATELRGGSKLKPSTRNKT